MSSTDRSHPPVSRAILTLLAAGLLLTLHSSSGTYGGLWERAETHVANGERTAAVAAYETLMGLRPGNPMPCLALAEVHLGWGRPGEALEALSEAEARGARSVEVAKLRAFVHARRAERSVEERVSSWAAAAEYGDRAIALGASSVELQELVARAHLASGDWSAAAATYEAILHVDPRHDIAHERMGALLVGLEPGARDHLLTAGTDLASQLLEALDESGGPKSPSETHAAVGLVLFRDRAWALAARHLELAVEDDPADGERQAYLGHAWDQMGYQEEARRHLLKAVESSPGSVLSRTFLGLHYDRWGNVAAARTAYEKGYDLDPDSAALCLEIGQTWAAEGRYVAAEVWLREAASLRPDSPAVWEALARFYLDNHIVSNDRAVEATERLLALVPDKAEANDLRGWAAIQTGAYEAAETYLDRALKLEPDMASAYYHLGLLREAQGRGEDAASAFQRAIDLDTEGVLTGLIERSR